MNLIKIHLKLKQRTILFTYFIPNPGVKAFLPRRQLFPRFVALFFFHFFGWRIYASHRSTCGCGKRTEMLGSGNGSRMTYWCTHQIGIFLTSSRSGGGATTWYELAGWHSTFFSPIDSFYFSSHPLGFSSLGQQRMLCYWNINFFLKHFFSAFVGCCCFHASRSPSLSSWLFCSACCARSVCYLSEISNLDGFEHEVIIHS